MKKRLLTIIILAGLLPLSCTDDFDALNTDPTKASGESFDANLLLPSVQQNHVAATAGYNGGILFQSMWMQILASTTSGAANYYSNGDKYVISSNTNSYLASTWNTDFRAASLAYEMEQLTKDKPALANLMNIAIIMQVQCISNISDTYGDVPYTQALQAKSGITLPVYDTQESVYKSLLTRLETATAALSADAALPTNDSFAGYKGDITKWKKYGYSLMLKLAMRLTKADPATAKTYAEKAAAGGTFASVADDAYVVMDDANGYTNGNGAALSTPADIYQVRWSKTLIDYLRANNDPRLGKIAEVPAAGLTANQEFTTAGNTAPAAQLGLPNGYDMNGGATDISKTAGYPGGTGAGANVTPIGKYSRPVAAFRGRSAPLFVLTYAETELLLAEAVTRGYAVGGTAAAHYKNGVSAGIQSLGKYGATVEIPAATADAYATANPLVAANALKQINEQIWATTGTLFNFSEAWHNWKRSGFPVLTPVNYVGNFSGGAIPRRQPYPTTEATQNSANYSDAVGRLASGDNWVSRIWWDK
ncbi:SusD/RagB family nutrient-binding outer membrane lipoprotein [Dyadobacter fanqingshengii]|uniref:SusD/RagB family nutrient-binding outer membrane lipoprotein n=1 Tax=Dyadobacter fanqingshengii TaxID=2906443 RepID=A0A9X1P8Y4_9BACT|nr:SusD/RagB family nutrient-binding outer membrane lipoprotein [Dyadobacter fanqingshengii]MCF0039463.1 SusD/RagB family nutrient-binding outer membrane lipoprotein [Dyadobacter fanqingshengii]MCF2502997.1 SusD/RagB family nutrient-binding outer membrane lipoprotein [Dyadobacter fanqingshengii]USJ33727.1 SusD/RagB family nutrient-binding outer membrane lipoprotein [Dyadobacter fanqingshengii]